MPKRMTPRASAMVAWLVCLAALVVPVARAPAAATPLQARVPFGPLLVGEVMRVTGQAGTGARPLELHARDRDGWRLLQSGVADPGGRFSFLVTVTRAESHFEVRAPGTTVGGVAYPAAPSAAVSFRAVAPTASLRIFTAPIGQSRSGARDLTPATATFTPRRPGAPVTIQRRTGDSWVTVGTGTQDGAGRFTHQVAAGSRSAPHTFRAGTVPADGAEPVYSAAVTADVWRQVWADEFEGSALGPAWHVRPSHGLMRRCAFTSPDNTSVAGGTVELFVMQDRSRPADDTCPYGRFFNAHIGTQKSEAFRYGAFAARVRFSPDKGEHGAFWLQPRDAPTGPDPEHAGSEIDVAEYFGDDERRGGLAAWVHWTSHLVDGEPQRVATGRRLPAVAGMLAAGRTPSDSYHVVSVEWTPQEYVFRFDGVETFRTTDGVSHRPQFLILSMQSSDWELPDRTAGMASRMSVDWVRVWQS